MKAYDEILISGEATRREIGFSEDDAPDDAEIAARVAVTRAIPSLEGKFDGLAYRVPVIAGSMSDITLVASRKVTVEEINSILSEAAMSPRWKGILAVTRDPIVSSDIVGQPYGAIVDLSLTKVVDGDLVKVISWYDNEWGYIATLVAHILAALGIK